MRKGRTKPVGARRVHADGQVVDDPDLHPGVLGGPLGVCELGGGQPGEAAVEVDPVQQLRRGRGRSPGSGGRAGARASCASRGRAPRRARTTGRGPPAPGPARRGSRSRPRGGRG
ncbi:hypothetical protein BSAF29S_00321 [Bacillus safensis subsp. safensis]